GRAAAALPPGRTAASTVHIRIANDPVPRTMCSADTPWRAASAATSSPHDSLYRHAMPRDACAAASARGLGPYGFSLAASRILAGTSAAVAAGGTVGDPIGPLGTGS